MNWPFGDLLPLRYRVILADPFMASIWACGLLWVGISFGVVPLRAASLERQGWQRQP